MAEVKDLHTAATFWGCEYLLECLADPRFLPASHPQRTDEVPGGSPMLLLCHLVAASLQTHNTPTEAPPPFHQSSFVLVFQTHALPH